MNVQLLAHTPEPEKLITTAAKLCYSKTNACGIYEKLTEENVDKFIKMLADLGHESPLEHASFTFAIDGVSRSLLAQITRHRIASFSVQSQRYVNLGDTFEYITPPIIASNSMYKELFDEAVNESFEAYKTLTAAITADLATNGMERKKAEKIAIENARAVLPNACETKMIVTMNARELMHFFNKRCCNRAQDEIRALADEMLRLCKGVAPILFSHAGAPCVSGACPEGKMSCGSPRKG